VGKDEVAERGVAGLDSVLDRLLAERPWAVGMALGELGRRWDDVVGERLAAECTPVALEDGALTVRASSAAWAAQLRFLAREVAAQANQVLGREAVREVRVSVDPGSVGS